MENKFTKGNVVGGFFWTMAERFGAQGVSFVVSIILARILTPDDYGIVAIVSIFTSIANVLIKSGLGTALIQKKDADSVDFSTIFYFNIFSSLTLYVVIFFAAPYIAAFYENSELTLVLRISALVLILNGINNVQQAYVSKHIDFKKFFMSTLIGTLVSAVVGITMAYVGCGVWALVVQQLLNSFMDTVILQLTIAWKPTLQFSFKRLKKMYRFGWKILVTEVSSSIYNNLQSLVIGKRYSSADLALYNKGSIFPNILARNLDNSVQSVTFPLLASVQDNHARFRHLMFRACTMSYFVICPMMIGLVVVAKPLVQTLLTDKWIGCVPYLQLYCFVYLLRPLAATNLQALYALGKSDIVLKLDVVKKIVGIVLLTFVVVVFDSVMAICAILVVSASLETMLNMTMVSKQVGYKISQQVKSVLGITAAAVVMGMGCYGIGRILHGASPLVTLLVQISVGVVLYCLACMLFRLQAFQYAVDYVKSWIKGRKSKKLST